MDPDGQYVYYDIHDCAGFWRRAASLVVDLVAIALITIFFLWVLSTVGLVSMDVDPTPRTLALLCVPAYVYLTVLKRSSVRTPGYWLTGLRIVDLKGRPPSMFTMSLRLAWWLLGPINPILDFLYLSEDEQRQTIRDKLMGTLVVKVAAHPAGHGAKTYDRAGFMGLMLTFPTVKRPRGAASDQST